jgi:hypothetical protein
MQVSKPWPIQRRDAREYRRTGLAGNFKLEDHTETMNYLTEGNQTNVRGEFLGTPAPTSADSLLLPGSPANRVFANVASDVITRTLIAAGVTGISANKGRGVNADLYVAYINQISKTAGEAAVASWLASH